MKKYLTTGLVSLLLLLALALPASAAHEAGDFIHILYTNDIHAALDDLPAVAAQKWALEDLYGDDHVIVVDTGDALQGASIGNWTEGAYPVDMLNAVGYDFAVPGVHDFAFGMEALVELAQNRAEFEYLCCNLLDGQGAPLFTPYKLVTCGSTKVAFVGITSPDALNKNSAALRGYSLSGDESGQALYAVVQKTVDEARKAGADYVVAMGHLGMTGVPAQWSSAAVIANTTGIDLFLDGNSHETYETTAKNKTGKDVPLLQAGSQLSSLGCASFFPDGVVEPSQLALSVKDPQHPEVAALLAKLKAQLKPPINPPTSGTSKPVTPVEPEKPAFTDLDPNAWYYAAVQNALDKGLMAGTGAGIFSPNAKLTRAMVVQILYSMEGKPTVSGSPNFTDVAANAWYAAAVKWAADNGIVSGMGNGTFAPNANVTREQLALILMGYAKAEGRDVSAATNLAPYTDASRISAWAQSGMKWAVGAGIISGRTATTLDPLGTATRAEMAQMILKFEVNINGPWDYWNRFIDDVCFRDELTAVQRPAVVCFWYDALVNNGGHSAYFDSFEYSQTTSEELAQALTTVAGPEFAENFRKALTKEEEENGYEETDDAFYDFEPSLTDLLEDYVERHLDKIFR